MSKENHRKIVSKKFAIEEKIFSSLTFLEKMVLKENTLTLLSLFINILFLEKEIMLNYLINLERKDILKLGLMEKLLTLGHH